MLSVIVIAKNEEQRIKTCLESVKWADEIILADNGSTDHTIELAKKYTQNIITFKGRDFSALRNKAIERANGDWVLYVDADERVSKALRTEVLELIQNNNFSAYAISRRNIIFGEEKKYGPFWPDWVVRLLHKKDFNKWEGRVHESPKFNGNLGYTKNSLMHLTHRELDHIILKSLDWSNIDAKLRLEDNHPKITGWRIIRILITESFNQLIKRRGITGGTIGVMDSVLQTFSLVMSYIRLWELQQTKPLSEKYKLLDEKLIKEDFKY